MMKFAKGTDKVLTIIYTVFSVLLIATFILLLIYAGGLMNNAGGSIIKAGSYSPDDYTAGYRFMGHLFYGGLSFTASVFLYIIAIYAALFALPLIIITIFAYVGMALYKKTHTRDYTDATLGGLAQLARAPALQAGGQGFDSLILHSWIERFGVH